MIRGAAVLWVALAMSAADEGSNSMTNVWRNLTPGTSRVDDVKAALGEPSRDAEGVTRGSIGGLRMLDYPSPQCSVFLRNGILMMISLVPREGDGVPLDAPALAQELGPPPRRLQSARGKNAWTHVYSSKGIAVTVLAGKVRAVEFFPPMSVDDYEKRLYIRPPKFVK